MLIMVMVTVVVVVVMTVARVASGNWQLTRPPRTWDFYSIIAGMYP